MQWNTPATLDSEFTQTYSMTLGSMGGQHRAQDLQLHQLLCCGGVGQQGSAEF